MWLVAGANTLRALLRWRMESDNELRVLVVLEADTVVVTMPGTRYSITYRKLHDTPWLVASDVRDDPASQINKYTFRARAWTVTLAPMVDFD